MKKEIRNVALAVSLAVLPALTVQADDDLRAQSQQAVSDFQRTDPSLQKFLDSSAGYAVFPDVGKGGLIIGGAHGKGVVYQKKNVIGLATLSQASIGAQAGGQTFAEIIFFETPAALNDFKSGKFEMSAEASAIAAKEGASTTANYKQGVVVFTLPKKGLMASAAVGGQKFTFEPTQLQPTGPGQPPTPKNP
jgi:lipid-binding SYLF domain-containing protein